MSKNVCVCVCMILIELKSIFIMIIIMVGGWFEFHIFCQLLLRKMVLLLLHCMTKTHKLEKNGKKVFISSRSGIERFIYSWNSGICVSIVHMSVCVVVVVWVWIYTPNHDDIIIIVGSFFSIGSFLLEQFFFFWFFLVPGVVVIMMVFIFLVVADINVEMDHLSLCGQDDDHHNTIIIIIISLEGKQSSVKIFFWIVFFTFSMCFNYEFY